MGANITGGNATFSPAKTDTGITMIHVGTLQASASSAFATAANIPFNGGARPATSDAVIGDFTGVSVEQNARASVNSTKTGEACPRTHSVIFQSTFYETKRSSFYWNLD
jgi:hypothetical protein